jgi:hypothetical protein
MDHSTQRHDDLAPEQCAASEGGANPADEGIGRPDPRRECAHPFDIPDDRTLEPRREDHERIARSGVMEEIGLSWIELTNGDTIAADWMIKWVKYCHAIDDLIDEVFSPELLLDVLAQAVELYSHTFFIAHVNHLRPIVIAVTNCYADSVRWERSEDRAERQMADVLRLAGVEMYCIVAGICGGYSHMRKVSGQVRKHTWNANHDAAGNPD